MASVTSISLADAQATPVTHVFTPIGVENNVWTWEDQSSPSAIGFWRITASLTRPPAGTAGQPASRVNRVKLTFSQPQLETLGTNDAGYTPPPTVAYVERFNCEFVLAERDVLQNRKDLRKMSMNLLNDSQIVAMIESLQAVY